MARACSGSVSEHYLLLRGQQRPGTQNRAGLSGVGGSDEIGMGTCGALRGQPQHLRAQGSQHQARSRNAVAEQHIDVARHRLVGLGVALGRLAVPRAHAEQETARVAGLDPGERGSDLPGVALPHVDDAGGQDERGRLVQQLLDLREVAAG